MRLPALTRRIRFLPAAALCAVLVMACGGKPVPRESFVGKWKSSKLETPLVLYENGDWEIRKDDGSVLQYGVWTYTGGNLVWSVKVNAQIVHDANRVLSVAPREFRLAEAGGTTVFQRLE